MRISKFTGKRQVLEKLKNTAKLSLTGMIFFLLLVTLTSCGGVTPEPPTPIPPGPPQDEIADSHKVTAIEPYYETEQGEHYCLISKGVIVTNYESSQKVLTQQELADAIFGTAGAKASDLVSYINGRNDLNLKSEIQYLSIPEIQRMLEDDITPIVVIQNGADVLLPVGYNKEKNEITTYSTLDGKEHTMYEFKYLDPNSNKSVMIINKEKLSTYLDNLSQ